MHYSQIQAYEDACFDRYSAELELQEMLEMEAGEIAGEICKDADELIRHADDMMDIAIGDDFLSEALLRYLVTGDEALKRRIIGEIHERIAESESVQEMARIAVCGK